MTKQRFMKILSWYLIISMVFQMLPIPMMVAYAEENSTRGRYDGLPSGPVLYLIRNGTTEPKEYMGDLIVPPPTDGYMWVDVSCTNDSQSCQEIPADTVITETMTLKEVLRANQYYRIELRIQQGDGEKPIPDGFWPVGVGEPVFMYAYAGETVILPSLSDYPGWAFKNPWAATGIDTHGGLYFTMPSNDVNGMQATVWQKRVQVKSDVDVDEGVESAYCQVSPENIPEMMAMTGAYPTVNINIMKEQPFTENNQQWLTKVLGWSVAWGDGQEQWISFDAAITPQKSDTPDYDPEKDIWTERQYKGHCINYLVQDGIDPDLRVQAKNVFQEYNGETITGEGTASKPGATVWYAVLDENDNPGEWTTTPPQIKDAGKLVYLVKATLDELESEPAIGVLEVTPRKVLLTSATAQKLYDGTPLTAHEVTISGSGFVQGEGATFDVTGSQTNVGSSNNWFTYTLKAGTKAENYRIDFKLGKLTVVDTAGYYIVNHYGCASNFNTNGNGNSYKNHCILLDHDLKPANLGSNIQVHENNYPGYHFVRTGFGDAGYWYATPLQTVGQEFDLIYQADSNQYRYTVEYYYKDDINADYPSTTNEKDNSRTGTKNTTVSVRTEDLSRTKNDRYELDTSMSNDWSGYLDGDMTLVLKVYYKPRKYTVTYLPGEHGTFEPQIYDNKNLGEQTPPFVGNTTGEDHWTFKGWSPVVKPYVEGDAVYVAQWKEDYHYHLKYWGCERDSYDNCELLESSTHYPTDMIPASAGGIGAVVEYETNTKTFNPPRPEYVYWNDNMDRGHWWYDDDQTFNVYFKKADPVYIPAGALSEKIVTGNGFTPVRFQFQLTGNGLNATNSLYVSQAGIQSILFPALGTIEIKSPGTYTYYVQELTTANQLGAGWTTNNNPQPVTVKVEHNDSNTGLKYSITKATITNSYTEPLIVNTIEEDAEFAKKTVESKTGFAAKDFTFTLSGEDLEAPITTTVNFTEAGTKAINFGKITYDHAGTYTYTVSETAEDATGWTFDSDEHTVTVVVTDNGGTLSAQVTGTELTNRYETSVVVNTTATGAEFAQKTVEGTGFAARDFMFTMSGGNLGAQRTQTVNFTEAGTKAIDFGTITYTEAGTYSYTVRETAVTAEGWTFDLADHTVTVTVTDTNGTLTAAVSGTTLTNRWVPQTYPVTVRYVDLITGEDIIPPVIIQVPTGGSYSIESPDIPGYVLFGDEIVTGTVTNAGVTRVVPYAPVTVPGGGPAGGGEPSGEGDPETQLTLYTLIDIDDLETPLGLGGLNLNVGECIE